VPASFWYLLEFECERGWKLNGRTHLPVISLASVAPGMRSLLLQLRIGPLAVALAGEVTFLGGLLEATEEQIEIENWKKIESTQRASLSLVKLLNYQGAET
jgi:hypothetical protein